MKRNLWLLLAAAVCGVSLWAGVRAGGRAPAAHTPTEPDPVVHLRVLNGTEAAGLARDLGRSLGAAGLVIEGVGNAGTPARRTLLVNRRLEEGAARRLGERLGGLPVVREWDARCSEDAVLLLGADWGLVRDALAAPAGKAAVRS